ncbi:hypothetical protein [Marinicrinis sediminis]|uniref:Uncharacterized protein n=1 Tax=Marinicrinis sediminis TaxID=1652465 RepID=A0ABW5R8R0_9BACL
MKKGWLIGLPAVLVIGMIAAMFIEVETEPPGDTRIILERTHSTYIAPPCFEHAETTNNLSETSLAKAKELHFKPESVCTTDALQPQKQSLMNLLEQKIGLGKGKWDW